eukprot:scaffold127859_cov24-Prasinocladus_malaysianus.AAC.1
MQASSLPFTSLLFTSYNAMHDNICCFQGGCLGSGGSWTSQVGPPGTAPVPGSSWPRAWCSVASGQTVNPGCPPVPPWPGTAWTPGWPRRSLSAGPSATAA